MKRINFYKIKKNKLNKEYFIKKVNKNKLNKGKISAIKTILTLYGGYDKKLYNIKIIIEKIDK